MWFDVRCGVSALRLVQFIRRCSVHGLYTVEIHILESSLLAPLPPDTYIYHAW